MKRAILVISDKLITDVLKATLTTDRKITSVVKHALPDDVKIIRAGHNNNGTLRLLLESEEFEDIKHDKPYPELPCPHLRAEILCKHNINISKYCLSCNRIYNVEG